MANGSRELYVFDTDIISECLRQNAQALAFLFTKDFLATFPAIFPMNKEAASIFFDLTKQRGLRKIGRRDLMIASIAIAQRATLVTGNVQHFARVPRLKVRDWRGR